MSIQNIGRKLRRKMARIAAKGGMNAGPVVLRWREGGSGAPAFDPELRASKSAVAWEEKSETKNAFIHYVSAGSTGYTRYAEVRLGDVILDFPELADIDGRADLQFEIGGEIYVQKKVGEDLARSWDVRCGGEPITRTVLVSPKS